MRRSVRTNSPDQEAEKGDPWFCPDVCRRRPARRRFSESRRAGLSQGSIYHWYRMPALPLAPNRFSPKRTSALTKPEVRPEKMLSMPPISLGYARQRRQTTSFSGAAPDPGLQELGGGCGKFAQRSTGSPAVAPVFPCGRVRCGVKSCPDGREVRLPLSPRNRTQVGHRLRSVWCQIRTHGLRSASTGSG
jgi:hypothetical protein